MLWGLAALAIVAIVAIVVRRKRRQGSDPRRSAPRSSTWTLPGGTRAEPALMPEAMLDRVVEAHDGYLEAHPETERVEIEWYVVHHEDLATDPLNRGKFPVEWRGVRIHTYGWTAGNRIAVSPVAPRSTYEHEVRHVYGEHHDRAGRWE